MAKSRLIKSLNQTFLLSLAFGLFFSIAQAQNAEGTVNNSKRLLVGATLNHNELNTKKEELYLRHFKYLTPANAAKQTKIHPRPNVWDWSYIDDFINFAKKHQLSLRLHGPISPQSSKWVKDDSRTPEELAKILEEFLTAFCLKFNAEPVVKWMDVVNETVESDGQWFGPKEGTHQWENPWLAMGKDENGFPLYILKAFEIATLNAPNIKLVYNQHKGVEDQVWNKIKENVLYLRSKGYRVDGIGWQAHLMMGAKRKDFVNNLEQSMEKLGNLIDWVHQNDLAFHITELDYLVEDLNKLESELEIQKTVYEAIVKVLLEKSVNGEVTLNLWDVATRDKPGKGQFQSIYNSKFQPNPAIEPILNALSN